MTLSFLKPSLTSPLIHPNPQVDEEALFPVFTELQHIRGGLYIIDNTHLTSLAFFGQALRSVGDFTIHNNPHLADARISGLLVQNTALSRLGENLALCLQQAPFKNWVLPPAPTCFGIRVDFEILLSGGGAAEARTLAALERTLRSELADLVAYAEAAGGALWLVQEQQLLECTAFPGYQTHSMPSATQTAGMHSINASTSTASAPAAEGAVLVMGYLAPVPAGSFAATRLMALRFDLGPEARADMVHRPVLSSDSRPREASLALTLYAQSDTGAMTARWEDVSPFSSADELTLEVRLNAVAEEDTVGMDAVDRAEAALQCSTLPQAPRVIMRAKAEEMVSAFLPWHAFSIPRGTLSLDLPASFARDMPVQMRLSAIKDGTFFRSPAVTRIFHANITDAAVMTITSFNTTALSVTWQANPAWATVLAGFRLVVQSLPRLGDESSSAGARTIFDQQLQATAAFNYQQYLSCAVDVCVQPNTPFRATLTPLMFRSVVDAAQVSSIEAAVVSMPLAPRVALSLNATDMRVAGPGAVSADIMLSYDDARDAVLASVYTVCQPNGSVAPHADPLSRSAANITWLTAMPPPMLPDIERQRVVIILTELLPLMRYDCRARGLNTAGGSPDLAFVMLTPPAAPSAPQNVEIMLIDEGRARLVWHAPRVQGAPGLFYEVVITHNDAEEVIVYRGQAQYTEVALYSDIIDIQICTINTVGRGGCTLVSWAVGPNTPSHPASPSAATDGDTMLAIALSATFGLAFFVALIVLFVLHRSRARSGRPSMQLKAQLPTFVLEALSRMGSTVKEPRKVHVAHLQLLNTLGEGKYGTVSKALLDEHRGIPSFLVAVKRLKELATAQERLDLLLEAGIMCQMEHPNVISLIGLVEEPELMLVTEYCEFGSLHSFLSATNIEDVNALAEMAADVARGMAFIANMGFVHRDLAARNVLVCSDYTCKIADFGYARDLSIDDYGQARFTAERGEVPVRWTPPEAVQSGEYSTATDVWSFGIVLWETFSDARKPYESWPNARVYQEVRDGYRLPKPEKATDMIYGIMRLCWLPSAESRPIFTWLASALENHATLPSNMLDEIEGQQLDERTGDADNTSFTGNLLASSRRSTECSEPRRISEMSTTSMLAELETFAGGFTNAAQEQSSKRRCSGRGDPRRLGTLEPHAEEEGIIDGDSEGSDGGKGTSESKGSGRRRAVRKGATTAMSRQARVTTSTSEEEDGDDEEQEEGKEVRKPPSSIKPRSASLSGARGRARSSNWKVGSVGDLRITPSDCDRGYNDDNGSADMADKHYANMRELTGDMVASVSPRAHPSSPAAPPSRVRTATSDAQASLPAISSRRRSTRISITSSGADSQLGSIPPMRRSGLFRLGRRSVTCTSPDDGQRQSVDATGEGALMLPWQQSSLNSLPGAGARCSHSPYSVDPPSAARGPSLTRRLSHSASPVVERRAMSRTPDPITSRRRRSTWRHNSRPRSAAGERESQQLAVMEEDARATTPSRRFALMESIVAKSKSSTPMPAAALDSGGSDPPAADSDYVDLVGQNGIISAFDENVGLPRTHCHDASAAIEVLAAPIEDETDSEDEDAFPVPRREASKLDDGRRTFMGHEDEVFGERLGSSHPCARSVETILEHVHSDSESEDFVLAMGEEDEATEPTEQPFGQGSVLDALRKERLWSSSDSSASGGHSVTLAALAAARNLKESKERCRLSRGLPATKSKSPTRVQDGAAGDGRPEVNRGWNPSQRDSLSSVGILFSNTSSTRSSFDAPAGIRSWDSNWHHGPGKGPGKPALESGLRRAAVSAVGVAAALRSTVTPDQTPGPQKVLGAADGRSIRSVSSDHSTDVESKRDSLASADPLDGSHEVRYAVARKSSGWSSVTSNGEVRHGRNSFARRRDELAFLRSLDEEEELSDYSALDTDAVLTTEAHGSEVAIPEGRHQDAPQAFSSLREGTLIPRTGRMFCEDTLDLETGEKYDSGSDSGARSISQSVAKEFPSSDSTQMRSSCCSSPGQGPAGTNGGAKPFLRPPANLPIPHESEAARTSELLGQQTALMLSGGLCHSSSLSEMPAPPARDMLGVTPGDDATSGSSLRLPSPKTTSLRARMEDDTPSSLITFAEPGQTPV